jgi:ribosomal protein S27E
MLVHEGNTHSHTAGSDRYCRNCNDVALAYDPTAERPRCRSCGKLG